MEKLLLAALLHRSQNETKNLQPRHKAHAEADEDVIDFVGILEIFCGGLTAMLEA